MQLLNAAGHCTSYEAVEKTKARIVKNEIERYYAKCGIIVQFNLFNLEYGKFTQFAADNININVETLHGKGMFNETQYAAFQYGIQKENVGNEARGISTQRCLSLSMPPEFHTILSSGYTNKKCPTPVFPLCDSAWFESTDESLNLSKTKDLALANVSRTCAKILLSIG